MTPWTVREATEADLPSISRIRVAGWQRGYAGLLPDEVLDGMSTEDDLARRRELFGTLGPEFGALVATDPAGAVAGFTNIGPYRLSCKDIGRTELSPTEGEVYALYVDPGRWRAGAGRALLSAGVRWLSLRERGSVRLWVLAANDRARRFYENGGFAADGAAALFRAGEVRVPEVRYSLVTARA